MARLYIVLLLLVLTPNSFALEVFQSPGHSQWTFFYSENKNWIVESVALDAAGWPKLERREVFDRIETARMSLGSEAALLTKIRRLSLPEDTRELRGRPGQSLWVVTNEWSWEWELKYSEWVRTETDRFWWLKHGLATDCADVAYSARWIFARNNGLPMANRFGSGQWFTHQSVKPEWERLPTAKEWYNDKRFLAGLNYMLDFVFTHSLWRDSYPIAITPESFMPGAHHLVLQGRTGHTQLVHQVGHQPDQIPVLTLNSTVPREKRELAEYIFFVTETNANNNAVQRIRWPRWPGGTVGLVDAQDMPFYSTEQFDPAFVQAPRNFFWQEVFHRLNPGADFDLIAQRTARQILELLRQRIQVVEEGYQVCAASGCPQGSAAWEAWSTPSRDGRIRAAIEVFRGLQQYASRPELLEQILETPVLNQEGHTFTMSMLMRGSMQNLFSFDPNDDPVLRWGVHPRAAAEKMRRLYDRGLSLRDAQLNKSHSCRTSQCLFGSREFQRAGSFELDNEFWSAALLVNEYCDHFGDGMCNELSTILRTTSVTAHAQTKTIWDWLQDSYFFNSDPRHSGERRYSSLTKEIPHLVLKAEDLDGFSVFNKQLVFIGGEESRELLAVQGADLTPLPVPAGETFEALDPVAGWIWTSLGEFVLARKNIADAPLRFMLPVAADSAIAYGGTLIVRYRDQSHVLRVENGVIQDVDQMPVSFLRLRPGGLALARSGVMDMMIDMETGRRFALPPSSNVLEAGRFNGSYLLKLALAGEGRTVCQMIAADGTVTDLTPQGSCINFSPLQKQGIFDIGGRAIKRTFQNGAVVREEDVGQLPEYYDGRFFRTSGPAGPRYFCYSAGALDELTKTAGVKELASCNDLYVIEAWDAEDWRVRERATGDTVLRSQAFLMFASAAAQEHYVVTGQRRDNGQEFALMDLRHPDRFALLTDNSLWPSFEDYDRAGGLMIYKNGRMVWLSE